jgi:hypothetical protein
LLLILIADSMLGVLYNLSEEEVQSRRNQPSDVVEKEKGKKKKMRDSSRAIKYTHKLRPSVLEKTSLVAVLLDEFHEGSKNEVRNHPRNTAVRPATASVSPLCTGDSQVIVKRKEKGPTRIRGMKCEMCNNRDKGGVAIDFLASAKERRVSSRPSSAFTSVPRQELFPSAALRHHGGDVRMMEREIKDQQTRCANKTLRYLKYVQSGVANGDHKEESGGGFKGLVPREKRVHNQL